MTPSFSRGWRVVCDTSWWYRPVLSSPLVMLSLPAPEMPTRSKTGVARTKATVSSDGLYASSFCFRRAWTSVLSMRKVYSSVRLASRYLRYLADTAARLFFDVDGFMVACGRTQVTFERSPT